MDLAQFWRENSSAALAFSGGVDSAYLLYSAAEAGVDITAYFVKTEFQPKFELDDAQRLASQLGAKLRVIPLSVLEDPQVATNPADRCYFCKRRLFHAILCQAAADGYSTLLDGTNASDDVLDRPGMQALQELEVLSPLRLCGLTKAEIRRRSHAVGLFTWDKPAYACLATRFPTGIPLRAEELEAVEAAEGFLLSMGFRDLRIRYTADGVKLQLPAAQMSAALSQRKEILARLSPQFGEVTLDLLPRSEMSMEDDKVEDLVVELRCNLDDMTGEDIAFATEQLMEAGALDVWTTPITMKKGRPAVLLACLCYPDAADALTAMLLRHTITLGVRRINCDRTCLAPSVTRRGEVRVKTASGCGMFKEKAEFEDLAAMARIRGVSLAEIRRMLGL